MCDPFVYLLYIKCWRRSLEQKKSSFQTWLGASMARYLEMNYVHVSLQLTAMWGVNTYTTQVKLNKGTNGYQTSEQISLEIIRKKNEDALIHLSANKLNVIISGLAEGLDALAKVYIPHMHRTRHTYCKKYIHGGVHCHSFVGRGCLSMHILHLFTYFYLITPLTLIFVVEIRVIVIFFTTIHYRRTRPVLFM